MKKTKQPLLKRVKKPSLAKGVVVKSSASSKRRNNIVAKDPWGDYAGIFENDPVFEEVMELVEQERKQQKQSS